MIRVLSFIMVLSVSSSLAADDYYFKIGNNHSALPFSRFAKLAYKDFHVSYELGKSFTLKETKKYEWFQTANLGYFKHKFVQSGILLYSENGYERLVRPSLGLNAKLGAGYYHMFTATDIIEQNSNGVYEKKKDFGRPQAIFSFSIGLTKSIIPAVNTAPKLTIDYQIRMQTPFVKSYVPLLPYNVLKIGFIIPIHDKST
jgi:hypothetical protein